MPGRLITAPVALVLLLAFPLGSATPKPKPKRKIPPVVVQKSIRGVQLGMDTVRVREVLGRKPSKSRTSPHPIVERTRTWSFGRLRVVFDGTKSGARVISVNTTSRKDRTSRGVGVGTREPLVRKRVRGVSCRTEYGYRRCSIGKAKPGEAVTDFAISRKGRVWRVTLSRVLD